MSATLEIGDREIDAVASTIVSLVGRCVQSTIDSDGGLSENFCEFFPFNIYKKLRQRDYSQSILLKYYFHKSNFF